VAVWVLAGGVGAEPEPLLHLPFAGPGGGEGWVSWEGNPETVPGPVGQAVAFDGRDDRLIFSPQALAAMKELGQGTIAFWFRFEDVLHRQAILPLFYFGMAGERDEHNLLVIEIGHRRPGNRKLYVTWVAEDRVVLCFDTGFNLEPGQWYHFALVVSKQGNTGFLDGKELVERHYNFGHAGMRRFLADVESPQLAALGYGKTARGKSPRFLHLAGALDEFYLFPDPLTEAEIAALYAAGEPPPGSPQVVRDLVYREAEGIQLKLDIYYPDSGVPPYPLVIYIHGGGWRSGSKSSGAGLRFLPQFLAAGFALASVDYRLAPQWQFPAMIEDVKCTIRFLRAQAGELGLDPERVGLLGTSAGGHLAALAGVLPEEEFSPDCYPQVPARVGAVASFYGPTDLPRLFQEGGQRTLRRVFGVEDPQDPALWAASPVAWVSEDDPPFLLVHGTEDQVVPPEQSQVLAAALREAGVEVELVLVERAGHGLAPAGGTPVPSLDEVAQRLISFFQAVLGIAP